jgi:hypothetical protein
MPSYVRHSLLTVAAAALLGLPAASAEDAPPVDSSQLLQLLKTMKDSQLQQMKSLRQKAHQEAVAAAANPARAADLWEQAVQATRFDSGTQFREWKEKEGDALREKEIQDAFRLHFNWLALTLQKMGGATNRELLPAVIQHTKEAAAHQVMMENFEESAKHDKELAASGKHGAGAKDRKNNDDAIRTLNRQLMSESVSASVVAKWFKLDESIGDVAPKKGQGSGWESAAGNVDGMFEQIILPELREQKDPRVLEYWDVKIRREAEAASRSKRAFDSERFNLIARPKLLWSRARDEKAIGQPNRAVRDMMDLIKTYPTHPDAPEWITAVEQELAPQSATPSGTASASPAPAAPTR